MGISDKVEEEWYNIKETEEMSGEKEKQRNEENYDDECSGAAKSRMLQDKQR